METSERPRQRADQTNREIVLVVIVCAVAVVATLCVYVPGLRRLWVSLGSALFG
jgi:hypothetical protein